MKKAIVIVLSIFSILSCELDNESIKGVELETSGKEYYLNDIEITPFVDPKTGVEYLLFYEKDRFVSGAGRGLGIGLAVTPRLNADGTLRIVK